MIKENNYSVRGMVRNRKKVIRKVRKNDLEFLTWLYMEKIFENAFCYSIKENKDNIYIGSCKNI